MKTDTPTPMNDKRKASFALDTIRQLERELTAAREELAELKEEYGTWWAQKRIAIDELKEVTEQRDRLAEELKETKKHLKDANRGAEINAHALRINADKLISVTEQRDEARRLAEKYRNLSCEDQDEADATKLPWENN